MCYACVIANNYYYTMTHNDVIATYNCYGLISFSTVAIVDVISSPLSNDCVSIASVRCHVNDDQVSHVMIAPPSYYHNQSSSMTESACIYKAMVNYIH